MKNNNNEKYRVHLDFKDEDSGVATVVRPKKIDAGVFWNEVRSELNALQEHVCQTNINHF